MPGDILLIAKRHMADAEPYSVTTVMSQERAAQLRAGCQQPAGISSRRAISEKVVKNICSLSPRCVKQGIITEEAKNYLISWCSGDWTKVSRPTAYTHLTHRCAFPWHEEPALPNWAAPARFKHVDLNFPDNPHEAESSDSGAEMPPIEPS